MTPRLCRADERAAIAAIINRAATRYRGAVPDDCLHEPYMGEDKLANEIANGVTFWGCGADGRLAGVMGHQVVKDQALIRHAYVLPECQGHGIGSALMRFFLARTPGPMLVGTWAAAEWAIAFYQKHGFLLTTRDETVRLLNTYWAVSPRQIETSVVLRREG